GHGHAAEPLSDVAAATPRDAGAWRTGGNDAFDLVPMEMDLATREGGARTKATKRAAKKAAPKKAKSPKKAAPKKAAAKKAKTARKKGRKRTKADKKRGCQKKALGSPCQREF